MNHTVFVTLLTLQLSVAALPQTADWRSVQALPGGTKIKVQLIRGHTFGHCIFNGATDHELTCTVEHSNYRHVYPRGNVKAVYIAHSGALIGLGVGAAGGAILGASRSPIPGLGRGGTALVTGGIMGGVGAFVGMIADPFFHGRAVYRSQNKAPASPQNPSNPPPSDTAINSDVQDVPPPDPTIPCLRDGTTLQCVDQ